MVGILEGGARVLPDICVTCNVNFQKFNFSKSKLIQKDLKGHTYLKTVPQKKPSRGVSANFTGVSANFTGVPAKFAGVSANFGEGSPPTSQGSPYFRRGSPPSLQKVSVKFGVSRHFAESPHNLAGASLTYQPSLPISIYHGFKIWEGEFMYRGGVINLRWVAWRFYNYNCCVDLYFRINFIFI